MEKPMNKIRRLCVKLWCLPQEFLGWVVSKATHARKRGNYYEWDISSGSASIGTYIFLCPAHLGDETVLSHERGHTRQSYYLGWLWLPVIGIPSLVWAGCFRRYRKKHNVSYYSFYTEAWADRLGGVERRKEE